MDRNEGFKVGRPTVPGVYQVRGFNMFVRKDQQVIATVEVAVSKDPRDKRALVCNLHESNAEPRHEHWTRLEDCNASFEWRGPFILAAPSSPSA